jgi:DNA-binding PadR family transcriptional regulator
MPARPDSVSDTPLKTNWFHILLCLTDGEQHGYAIMREVLERTDGAVRLWPATLYGALRRLVDAGLIEESGGQPATDDMRRRFYRLTPEGRGVVAAEIRRLETLLRAARAKGRSLKTEPSS